MIKENMKLNRAIAPPIKEFEKLEIPQCRILVLDNGIKLNIIDHGEFDVNRLTMSWLGGAYDVDSFSALMLATELMREGTKLHTGAEIAENLDFNGAWLRNNFHSHHTSIVLHSLNNKLDSVLPTIVETITSPSFPLKEFEINREKIAKRKELNLSKVAYLSNQNNHQLIFGDNHPCAKDETVEEIYNISLNDIKEIQQNIFTTNGCELYLAGRITPQIEDTINNRFGQLKYFNNKISQNIIPISPSTTKLQFINVEDAMQSAITMSIPTIPRSNPDYIDLRYTIMALGGYFGSRLMTNIREDKGYTYGISASLLGNWEGGVATISTQCDNSYVKQVIDEVKKEIESLKYNDVDDDELNRLKQYAMTQIAGILDSPFSIMDYYENMRHVLTPTNYFYLMQQSLNNLTSERITTLAQQYLKVDELRISVAGNTQKIINMD